MWAVLSLLAPKRRVRRARGGVFRPRVEALEGRCCPSLSPGTFEWDDPTGGALDPTFGSGGQVINSFTNNYDAASALTTQPDGKIIIAGTSETSGSSTGYDFLVARYNADGSLDTSFGTGGLVTTDFNKNHDGVGAVALQPQASGPSKIVAGGGSGNRFALARYNANGSLDTTFGKKGEVTGYGISIQSIVVDGADRILMGGVENGTVVLARYTANGAPDTTFGNGGTLVTNLAYNGYGSHPSFALQADGKIVVATTRTDPATGTGEFVVARFNPNGTADPTFGSRGSVATHPGNEDAFGGVAIQGDGKIIVTGNEGGLDPDGVDRQGAYLLRYNADGSLDGTFGSGGIDYLVNPAGLLIEYGLQGVAVQPNGWIVDGLDLGDPSNGQGYFGALRVSPSGALDPGYGTGGWALVAFGYGAQPEAMALQPDGRVVLAGYTRPSGTTYPTDVALCRFLPAAPQIGSFTASASTVTAGSSVTLTASSITDENSGSSVAQVAFYITINGSGVLLGYGTQDSDGSWSYSFDTTGYASGTYTLYAQATDNFGALGNPVALTLTIQ